jgi:transcriptional regulator with XRE-family HTH domain
MNRYNELLGQKIQILRKQQNVTQEALAELVNRSKNHISKIEHGTTNPPLSLIFDIAIALGVHPQKLFDFAIQPLTLEKDVDIKSKISNITDKKQLKLIFDIYRLISNERFI